MPSAVRLWLKLIFDWPGYFKEQSPKVFCKKGVLRNISKLTGKHLCQILFFDKLMACNFIKKETLPQVFSCEFYKIPKNTFPQNTSGGCFCCLFSPVHWQRVLPFPLAIKVSWNFKECLRFCLVQKIHWKSNICLKFTLFQH